MHLLKEKALTNAEQVDYNFFETGSIVFGHRLESVANPWMSYFLISLEPVPISFFIILEPVPVTEVLIKMRYTYENDK